MSVKINLTLKASFSLVVTKTSIYLVFKGMPFGKKKKSLCHVYRCWICEFLKLQPDSTGVRGTGKQSAETQPFAGPGCISLCKRNPQCLVCLPSRSSPDTDFSVHYSCTLHDISKLRTNASRKLWDSGRAGGFSICEEVIPFSLNCL